MKHKTWSMIAGILLTVGVLAGCGNGALAPKSSSLASSQAPVTPTGLEATVMNSTIYIFNRLYISPTDTYEWGDDLLGSTNILKSNGSFDITLPTYEDGSYSILVVDQNDCNLVFEQVPLKNGCTLEFVWADEPGVFISYGQSESEYVGGIVESSDYYTGLLDPEDLSIIEPEPEPEPYVIPGVFDEPIGYSFGFDLYNDTPYAIEYVYLVPASVFDEVNRGLADEFAFEILNGLQWGIFDPDTAISVRGTINEAYEYESEWYLLVRDTYGELTSEDQMQISGQPSEWTEIHIQYDNGYIYEVWF